MRRGAELETLREKNETDFVHATGNQYSAFPRKGCSGQSLFLQKIGCIFLTMHFVQKDLIASPLLKILVFFVLVLMKTWFSFIIFHLRLNPSLNAQESILFLNWYICTTPPIISLPQPLRFV